MAKTIIKTVADFDKALTSIARRGASVVEALTPAAAFAFDQLTCANFAPMNKLIQTMASAPALPRRCTAKVLGEFMEANSLPVMIAKGDSGPRIAWSDNEDNANAVQAAKSSGSFELPEGFDPAFWGWKPESAGKTPFGEQELLEVMTKLAKRAAKAGINPTRFVKAAEAALKIAGG